MYFLGQAGNYSAGAILRHLFAFGSARDSEALREHLAKRYGTNRSRVVLYHTGRTALSEAVRALVPAGSEIVVTSLTCYAVFEAVKAAGCTPVFADVRFSDLHYGAKELEKVLKTHKKVRAVVIQNNLGTPCDIEAIEKTARAHGLVVIEDLAHCAGVRYKDGREAGTVGTAAALSFGKGKSIDTICGGALVLRDEKAKVPARPKDLPRFSDRLRDRIYPLLGAEIRGMYHFGVRSGRYFTSLLLHLHLIRRSADEALDPSVRLTHWQARLALRQFRRLPEKGRPPLRRACLVDDPEKVQRLLAKKGYIFYDTWYDVPVSPKRYYEKTGFDEKSCPNAVFAAAHLINLPGHYPFAELRDARNIIEKHQINSEVAK